MCAKILLAEDNLLAARTLAAFLERNGMQVTVAGDGPSAWALFQAEPFDLILLDVMMPGMTGLELCERMRAKSNVPILMVTARVGEEDLVAGLSLGADDYIRKPYSPREVVARCRRALVRQARPEPQGCISFKDLVLDIGTRRLHVAGKEIALTPAEFALLEHLMKRPGRVIPRQKLLEVCARDNPDVVDRTVDTHLYNLRRKIEAEPSQPTIIVTEYGVGYRFMAEQPE